eukprot:4980956-Amphidinium_carterae.1
MQREVFFAENSQRRVSASASGHLGKAQCRNPTSLLQLVAVVDQAQKSQSMIIDAYDLLEIDPDAGVEEVKKAFKRLSLQNHPDKVSGQGSADKHVATEKFMKIKEAFDLILPSCGSNIEASELLQDEDRKKIYDALGVDFGADRPEAEVWNAGFSGFGAPAMAFSAQTVVTRLALWLVAFRFVSILLVLVGVLAGLAYAANFKYKSFEIRHPDVSPLLLGVGIVEVAVLLNWAWPFLGEVICVLFLASQLVPDWTNMWLLGGLIPVGFFLAWLFQGS